MPRGNDAQTNESYYSPTSYPPSPPVQLPTPLPDERLSSIPHSALYASRMEAPDVQSPLIDLDTPTPPQQTLSLPADKALMLESDSDMDDVGSRSPPFREAPLPQDSPPPLPIRARVPSWRLEPSLEYQTADGSIMTEGRHFVGHSRTPTFSRTSPTPVSPIFTTSSATFENLSRTIRSYGPSSVASPTFPTSPPSNMRGVGVTWNYSPRRGHQAAGQQTFERDYELQDEEDTEYYGQPRAASHYENVDATTLGGQPTMSMGSSGLSQAMQRNTHAKTSPDQAEAINWARWDVLNERRLLIVGYACGLQVWDCTNLASIDEVLNLNLDSAEWRMLLASEGSDTLVRVVHAGVLPSPHNQYVSGDLFQDQRPLLGILLESASEGAPERTIFFLYSVQNKHQVVKRLDLPGAPSTFVSHEQFTVISTINPAILHILSSTTFQTLHQITPPSIELSTPQVSIIPQAIANFHTSSTTPAVPNPGSNASNRPGFPTASPVFALSHRLLAYASLSPSTVPYTTSEALNVTETRRFSSSANSSGAESSTSSPFGFGQITTITRTDVSQAALKVGETVFSGMKHFGGIALEAAKNRVVSGQPFGVTGHRRSSSGRVDSGIGGRFVSRSAPDHISVHNEGGTEEKPRQSSSTSNSPTKVAPATKSGRERGHYVTIVDLAPLVNQHEASKIDELMVSSSQPAVRIEFSADGTSIGVALRDGHSTRIFKLKPSPRIAARSSKVNTDEGGEAGYERGTAPRVYNLFRGLTSAVIESIVWAKDGQYIGVGTMNRTAHIYAINQYGGKPDLRSHLEGRIRNVETSEHLNTALSPIARIRGSRTGQNEPRAALALTFISDGELAAAPNLSPSSPSRRTPPLSPVNGKLGAKYQHILLFDPEDGVLSLHRLALEKIASREPIIGGVAASFQSLGVTSVSFPGTSNLGRLSTSPSAKPAGPAKSPESLMELGAKVDQVAIYNLKRGRDWEEVTNPLASMGSKKQTFPGRGWLAEAELSTCSTSHRSIYLSHQFSFHTLGEDYHALIRGYQLHVSGKKIDVRKEVEVRTSAWNIATFAEGFSSGLDTHREPSSFDEPISSAISGSFDNSNIPRILPMYPNGMPGTNVKSLRNSIPIRAISGLGDGVTERIRKEMRRVRSPRAATSTHSSAPLEFDEDDEFIRRTPGEDSTTTFSHLHSSGVGTQKLLDADIVGTVDEELFEGGWDVKDEEAIDEVEQFQDIGVAGYLVEEDEHRRQEKRRVHSKR